MKIKSVEYKKSVSINQSEVLFESRKEIIFVGRSNVWKSSMLNALFQKKNLAFTSSTPGKTRLANLYLVNGKYFFTDLPGYGFWKRGKENMKQMDELISWYLEEKKELVMCVVILIDSKLWPQSSDVDMYQYLKELELPLFIALTKTDKISQIQVNKTLHKTQELFFWEKIFVTSSEKKVWIDDLRHQLEWMLKS